MLYSLPLGGNVTIALVDISVVGLTTMEYLQDFIFYYEGNGGKVIVEGLEKLTPLSDHPQATRKLVNK